MLSVARFGTRDLERAKAFYDEIAALLGAKLVMERPEVVSYKGPDGGMFLVGKPFRGRGDRRQRDAGRVRRAEPGRGRCGPRQSA